MTDVLLSQSTNLTFDNSPSSTDKSGVFGQVDWSNAKIVDVSGLYTQETVYNGSTYKLGMAYNPFSGYITAITGTINGDTVVLMENVNATIATLLLYSGDTLNQIVYGKNDILIGGPNNDVIYGYLGDDYLFGRDGDDILNGGGGTDTLDGGKGEDTAVYFYSSKNYVVSKPLPNQPILEVMFSSGGSEVLYDIEKVQFRDVTISTADLTFKGSYSETPISAVNAVHRFYNTRDNAFFYTASDAERDYVLTNSLPQDSNTDSSWPYVYQGSTFEAAHTYSGTSPLYRFYNTETGHHFFTANEDEKNFVLSKSESGEWPFNYEGVAMQVYLSDPTSGDGQELPVHRFYSPSENRHFFTGDELEAEAIKLTGTWNYEGIGFFGEVLG